VCGANNLFNKAVETQVAQALVGSEEVLLFGMRCCYFNSSFPYFWMSKIVFGEAHFLHDVPDSEF
jgi:hypothetical protein